MGKNKHQTPTERKKSKGNPWGRRPQLNSVLAKRPYRSRKNHMKVLSALKTLEQSPLIDIEVIKKKNSLPITGFHHNKNNSNHRVRVNKFQPSNSKQTISQILRLLKEEYEQLQTFETVEIKEIQLETNKTMFSFFAHGKNEKCISIFSIVCTDNIYPVRLISSEQNETFTDDKDNLLTQRLNNLLTNRIQTINKHMGKH
ncbi:TPA: hypothetical protein ACGPFX_004793 [Bacillus pacificus]